MSEVMSDQEYTERLEADVARLQERVRADAFTCAALTGLLANPGMVDTMPPETERWIAEQAIRMGTLTAALAAGEGGTT